MKGKKRFKSLVIWLTLVLLAAFTGAPAGAADTGSITLRLCPDAAGVEMTLYKAAELHEGGFVYCEDFQDSGIVVEDMGDSEAAQEAARELAQYALEHQVQGVAAKVNGEGEAVFQNLSPALYLAAQTLGEELLKVQAAFIPIPYTKAGESAETFDAVISPKYSFPGGAVIVNKVDEEGNAVGDAHFVLQQKVAMEEGGTAPDGAETGTDDSGSYYWKEIEKDLVTSGNGQIAVKNIPIGDYRFVEVQAPDGFVLNGEPSYFSITKAGQIVEVEGVYQKDSGLVADVSVVNRQTSIQVNKVDEDGSPVSGARLVIKDADGNVILDDEGNAKYEFVTTDEPFVVKRLPAGDYLLSEVTSPEGYLVSEDVPITVSGADAETIEVTMVDEKEETSSGSLTVTKRLVDMAHQEMVAKEGVFHVALFKDEELTSRVSDVKEIEFHNQGTSSVTFRNLKLGSTYYVAETDAYGNAVEVLEVDGVYCVPMYPETVGITPKETEPEHKFEFDNMFADHPDGYYYVGRLTVTKEVLRGEEPYETDEVFYAGVFEDPEHTLLAMDVIPLEMNGSSQVSKTVELFIGEQVTDTKTYYVCETDEDGIPLDNDMDLEFTVSQDSSELTFGDGQIEHEFLITNTFYEEEPTPTPARATPAVTPLEATGTPVPTGTPATDGNNPPSSHQNGSTPSAGVRTGDDTPIGMFVVIFVAAAAVICGTVVYRKKQNRNK